MAQAIQMQRKNDSGVYENYYPNTVMSQVEGGIVMKAKIVAITGVANQTITISGDISQTVITDNDGGVTIYLPYGSYTLTAGSKTKSLMINAIRVYNITFFDAESVLNNNDWTTISAVSKAGLASNYWSIGDCKTITLNGTIGKNSYDNRDICSFIVGFDHNIDIETNGEHSILFSCGKTDLTNGKDVALIDAFYNSYSVKPCFHMNPSGTNQKGWSECWMRDVLCPDFKAALSSDLQGALRTRTIYTYNDYNFSGTSDTIYLPSEFEIQGTITYAKPGEQEKQQQFEYYKNGASKIRYDHDNSAVAVIWWTRSPSSTNSFCVVGTTGASDYSSANYSYGFAPCFTV